MKNIIVELYADGLVKPFPAVAWPGCYTLVYYDKSGDRLCADCATRQYDSDIWESGSGYMITGCDIYWGGPVILCAECEVCMESAYGEPVI